MVPTGRRMATSKNRLSMTWRDHRASDEFILGVEEVIQTLRKDDPRPLLIMRDCEGCQNKEGDLLKRTLEDERFLLATPWFHCVRLDNRALEEDHPYNKLFRGSKPAHVVLATWDGGKVLNVTRAGQKEIWKSMQVVLRSSYKKSAPKAMKGLSRLLEEFDALDNREEELLQQLAAKEAAGKEQRAEKIRKDIAELGEDRQEALDEEVKLRDLGMKFLKERDGEEESS